MASLLNGLSALGTGVAAFAGTAGIDAQKADLNKQAAILADQLATTRESAGRQEAAGLTSAENRRQEGFKSAEAVAADTRITARESTGRIQAAEIAEKADTPELKLLRALGALPSRNNAAPSASASPADGAAAAPSAVTSTPSAASGVDTSSPKVRQLLGIPAPGSDAAIRLALASDVDADPKYKGSTVGQKAAEVENRLAVAKGTIGSQEDQDSLAQQIAHYDLSPLDAKARMGAGGPGVMAKVNKINPKYNEANYAAVVEAKKAITPGGSLFVPISAMETSLDHASHFFELAKEIGNNNGGNWLNIIPNKLASSTGSAPLVNALQQTAFAMAEEGNRIYAGNAGTEGAINNWVKSFPVNGSLADQAAAVKNFAQLMGGKFDTLAYHLDKTFKDSGIPSVELLSPKSLATFKRLSNMKLPTGSPDDSYAGTGAEGTPPVAAPAAAPSHPPLPSGFRVIQ